MIFLDETAPTTILNGGWPSTRGRITVPTVGESGSWLLQCPNCVLNGGGGIIYFLKIC
jgi:hypothetical protein